MNVRCSYLISCATLWRLVKNGCGGGNIVDGGSGGRGGVKRNESIQGYTREGASGPDLATAFSPRPIVNDSSSNSQLTCLQPPSSQHRHRRHLCAPDTVIAIIFPSPKPKSSSTPRPRRCHFHYFLTTHAVTTRSHHHLLVPLAVVALL